MTKEEFELIKRKCFFPITVELLNHTHKESYGKNLNDKIESPTDRYVAVLDEENNRAFLGIKRIKKWQSKKPPINSVVTNAQADTFCADFFKMGLNYNKGTCISMSIDSNKNKFYSTHLGPKVKEIFFEEYKNEELWNNYTLLDKETNNLFKEIIDTIGGILEFIEDYFSEMKISVNIFNGYDIKDYSNMQIGLLWKGQDKNETEIFYQLIFIKERIYSNISNAYPIAMFKNEVGSFLKKMYVLNYFKIDFNMITPVIFDLKDIHFREDKLKDDQNKLNEAVSLKYEIEKYFCDLNKVYHYIDIYKFCSEVTHEWTELEMGSFKKHKNIFSDKKNHKPILEKILNKVLKGNENLRLYELEVEKEFSKIAYLVQTNKENNS